MQSRWTQRIYYPNLWELANNLFKSLSPHLMLKNMKSAGKAVRGKIRKPINTSWPRSEKRIRKNSRKPEHLQAPRCCFIRRRVSRSATTYVISNMVVASLWFFNKDSWEKDSLVTCLEKGNFFWSYRPTIKVQIQ